MNLPICNVSKLMSNKPGILLGLGFLLGVACVGTTAFETVKACDIIEEANNSLDNIENGDLTDEEKENKKKEIRKQTNLKIVRTYAIPVALGVASAVCHLSAYNILSAEKAAAITAMTATSAAFEKYRSRVVEKYGSEEDYNLYIGKSTVEVESEEVNEKTGKVKKVKKVLTVTDPIDSNIYTKIFSFETSGEWSPNRRMNIAKLEYYQRYWNEQLKRKGYVTYNEVIESLGFSRKVGPGMTEDFIPNGIGWISSDIAPDSMFDEIDTFIKFTPNVSYDDEPMNLVYSDAYLLRFNCYPIDKILQSASQTIRHGGH